MQIRTYQKSDDPQIVGLFYHTVHVVNCKDYSQAQLSVWAPDHIDTEQWCRPFLQDYTIVADEEGKIVGFANLDAAGCLDRLYVHKDYQRQGIGKQLVHCLETYGQKRGLNKITSDVSITAKPFFTAQGYTVVRENTVYRAGQSLQNFKMEKPLQQEPPMTADLSV